MRQPLTISLALALALTACQLAPGTKAPTRAGASPARPATRATSPAAAPSLLPGEAPRLLRPPAGATTRLVGGVYLDAAYATSQGGASRLIGPDGATLVGMDGGSLVGPDGATLVARGRIVATDGGNVAVPANLIGMDGASLIGIDGATLIGMDGASLVDPDGATLVGPDGASLTGPSGRAYHLTQAAPSELVPAAGMWLSVVDTRTGFTVPLGLDDQGRAVHTIYTDARGGFTVHVAPEVAAHTRLVARAPGLRDPHLVLSVFARGGAGPARIDEETARTTNFLRHVLAQRLLAIFTLDPAETEEAAAEGLKGDPTPAERMAAALGGTGVAAITDALKRVGALAMPPERQYELALLMADRLLVEIDYEHMTLGPIDASYVDPGAKAALEGKNALDEVQGFFRRLTAAAAARLEGQADPSAWFAARPWLIEANLRKAPAQRQRLTRPQELGDFVVHEYLGANDQEAFEKVHEVIHDFGLPVLERDRLKAVGEACVNQFLASLLATSAETGKPNAQLVVALVEQTGAQLSKAPPSTGAPAGGLPALPMPTPPAVEAYVVETIAGLPGAPGATDGAGSLARFNQPQGILLDPAAEPPVLYVADTDNHAIRRVALAPSGPMITTVAGVAAAGGMLDGRGADARFSAPVGLALDAERRLYVADSVSHAIRRVSFDATDQATVETLAGGAAGFADGDRAAARFDMPVGLAVAPNGDVIVADLRNSRLRRLVAARGWAVETIMGDGRPERVEGPLAQALVKEPSDVAFAPDGSLWIAQAGNDSIRQVAAPLGPLAPTRLVAGAGSEHGPLDGFFTGGWFNRPHGIAFDPQGRLLVADSETQRIRLVTSTGWVTTIAGSGPADAHEGAHADGPGASARFDRPNGLACAPDGTIYVADTGNHVIRRLRPRAN